MTQRCLRDLRVVSRGTSGARRWRVHRVIFCALGVLASVLGAASTARASGCTDIIEHRGYWTWHRHHLVVVEVSARNDCAEVAEGGGARSWKLYSAALAPVGSIRRRRRRWTAAPEKGIEPWVGTAVKALAEGLNSDRGRPRRSAPPPAFLRLGLTPLNMGRCQARVQLLDDGGSHLRTPRVRIYLKDPTIKADITIRRLSMRPRPNMDTLCCSAVLEPPGATLACGAVKGGTLMVAKGRYADTAGGVVSPTLLLITPDELAARRHNILGQRALRGGRHAEAQLHLQASLKLRPDLPVPNFNMACLLARTGRPFAEGKVFLDRAVRGGDRAMLWQIRADRDLAPWRQSGELGPWYRVAASASKR